jgi:hypothetical protein
MTRHTFDPRSWILITISFALGILVADFVDYQWQAVEDASTAVVVSQTAEVDAQR